MFSDPQAGCGDGSLCAYSFPFRFVIPNRLISARSNIRPEFLKLCPSARVGSSYRGPMSGTLYRQPLITYMIRVERIRTGLAVPRWMKYYYEREILVLPYTPPEPPLGIEHFPLGDYKSSCTKVIRQHMWTRQLGTLKIAAAEPSPLNVLTSAPRPATFASVEMVFKPHPGFGLDASPPSWKCVVRYHIRIRTFCSTRILERVPTSSTANDQCLAHDQKTASEVREYGVLRWDRDPHCLTPELFTPDGAGRACLWTATLVLSVNASKSLLPTFVNPLSSRQYALVVRLRIKGLCHGPLELVLPLQVIHYPAEGARGAREESERRNPDNVFPAASELSDPPSPLYNNMEGPPLIRSASPPPYNYS